MNMQKIGKQRLVVLCLIGVLLLSICNHYFIFYFHDKGLEQAVREHAVGSTILVGIEEEPYKQFYKRDKPLKGFIPRKIVRQIDSVYLNLIVYETKDIQDIKKFKNIEQFDIGIGSEGKRTGKKIDMPKNVNSLSTLRRLKEVSFSDMNIMTSDFADELKNVDRMILQRCAVDDYIFIEKFPSLKYLSINNMEISSVEFGKRLNSLEVLKLGHNQYQCSLEPIALFPNLKELLVWSETSEVFDIIPPLNTVKELTLRGGGAPDKDNVEQYLEWGNLERLELNDGYYDVKTKKWHDFGEE